MGDRGHVDPLDYEEVLGERGMAALREPAVEAWRGNRTGWAEKYLMERLAKAGGDIDAVIAVYAADLSPNGHTRLLIAREPDTARRPDEALRWAERGVRETRDLAAVDTALIDYLCERYAQAARLPDAVALRRDHFGVRRSLLAYQQLRAAARAADCWQGEREGALALLRADAGRRQPGWYGGPVLVDALLDDKDDKDGEAAWEAAADSGADDRQWLALADQTRADRPADALGVYLRLAEPLTKQTGNAVYEQLVGLLLSIRDCHRRLGTPGEFTAYAIALRALSYEWVSPSSAWEFPGSSLPPSPTISPPVSSSLDLRIRTRPVPRCRDECAGRPNRSENRAGTHVSARLTGLRPFGARHPSSRWSQTVAGQCGGGRHVRTAVRSCLTGTSPRCGRGTGPRPTDP